MAGVSIVEIGTGNGTISDVNGLFELTVTSSSSVLSFSYIGFRTQEVIVGERTVLNVLLQEDSEILDEIVVVGYGTKRKGNLAASVSTVRSEDIIRSASTTTAGALVGKISGITARQKSGVPGSSASLQIRNLGTPLYVIDGVMTDEGAFNNLDIHDIDNISVLKDGALRFMGSRHPMVWYWLLLKKEERNKNNKSMLMLTQAFNNGQNILSC